MGGKKAPQKPEKEGINSWSGWYCMAILAPAVSSITHGLSQGTVKKNKELLSAKGRTDDHQAKIIQPISNGTQKIRTGHSQK